MAMKEKFDFVSDEDLQRILNYAQILEVPMEWDFKGVWLYAIAEVRLRNGKRTLAVIARDENAKERILKVVDGRANVVEVLRVFPYVYLEKQFVPQLPPAAKEKKLTLIKETFAAEAPYTDFDSLTNEDIKHYIERIGIRRQLEFLRSKK